MVHPPPKGLVKIEVAPEEINKTQVGPNKSKISIETWIALGILLLTMLVYLQVMEFKFVSLDDPEYISSNATIQGGMSWKALKYAFTTGEDGSYLPLVWLSHAACVSLFGDWAGGHHLINLLLHEANSVLLFLFLRKTTKSLWPSAGVAFLFALHPLHVESVAWVSERKDVLSTLFWILTLMAYVYYVERPSISRYLGMAVLFILGLLSKSMLVTLPLTLLLFDVWPLRRIRRGIGKTVDSLTTWSLLKEKVPLFVLSFAIGLVTLRTQRGAGALASSIYPLHIRLQHSLQTSTEYLRQMVFPLNLGPYYIYPDGSPPISRLVLSLAILLAISLICVLNFRRRPYLAVGWGWYLITLLPVVGIIQVGSQAHADRYTYVPLIGAFLMLCWLAEDLYSRWPIPRMTLIALVGSLLGGMVTLTAAQTVVWRDSETLWRHALTLDPENVVALEQVGDFAMKEERFPEALDAYLKAVKHARSYILIAKVGDAFDMMGRDAEALHFYQYALGRHFENGQLLMSHPLIVDQRIGSSLTRFGQFDEAEPYVQKVLKASSSGSRKVALGPLQQASLIDWAVILRHRNHLQKSIEALEKVLANDPNYPRARVELGLSYCQMGRDEDAVSQMSKALDITPRQPKVLYPLGIELIHMHRFEEARRIFQRLKDVNPQSPLAQKAFFELEKAQAASTQGHGKVIDGAF